MLTELEYVVLAMIASGKTSGYAMRKELSRTRVQWSADSGSVYRVLRRLAEKHSIETTGRAGVPKRERVEYAITEIGEQQLHEWLRHRLDKEDFLHVTDPLRMRAQYISVLPAGERSTIIKEWMKRNDEECVELSRSLKTASEPESIAISNLLGLLTARGTWLKGLVPEFSHAVVESGSEAKVTV